ncbi:hypothetical protein [Aliikangiella maris]|uniref:Uncharacterized protein n=2 Tax=Aliikangiella maris TaxID=3162458 RepID=A0ABV2BZH7_9GAMM
MKISLINIEWSEKETEVIINAVKQWLLGGVGVSNLLKKDKASTKELSSDENNDET